MTTLTEHLAKHALRQRVWGWQCGCLLHSYGENLDLADVEKIHAAHAADTWREARTVRTVEELDALPDLTVLVPAALDHNLGYQISRSERGRFMLWAAGDPMPEFEMPLPALVVYRPDEDGAA